MRVSAIFWGYEASYQPLWRRRHGRQRPRMGRRLLQADYYAASPAENPSGPETGAKRVVRGGSWYNDASAMRAAARSILNPVEGYDTVGFRCVVL
jgi:formylglycine-generating enzyme required for sulfatase activity